MEKVAVAALAKYFMKIKSKGMTLEDTITVNDSIDLSGDAVADFIKELNAHQHRPEQKPKAEA